MAYEHTFITKDGHTTKTLTANQAIRQKCLECSVWQINEVRFCQAKDCALWPFRHGRRVDEFALSREFENQNE
jgi:hypothetical protein